MLICYRISWTLSRGVEETLCVCMERNTGHRTKIIFFFLVNLLDDDSFLSHPSPPAANSNGVDDGYDFSPLQVFGLRLNIISVMCGGWWISLLCGESNVHDDDACGSVFFFLHALFFQLC